MEFSNSVNNKVVLAKVYIDKGLTLHQHCLDVGRITQWKSKLFFKAFSCQDYDFYVFIFKTYIRPIVKSATPVWSPYHIQNTDIIKKGKEYSQNFFQYHLRLLIWLDFQTLNNKLTENEGRIISLKSFRKPVVPRFWKYCVVHKFNVKA